MSCKLHIMKDITAMTH